MNDPGSVKIERARRVMYDGIGVSVFGNSVSICKKKRNVSCPASVNDPAKLHFDGSLTSKGMCTHDFRQHGITVFVRNTVNMT